MPVTDQRGAIGSAVVGLEAGEGAVDGQREEGMVAEGHRLAVSPRGRWIATSRLIEGRQAR